jgi:quinoprotein glucose dehydrogenase
MSSIFHAGSAPTGYWASELQRYLARSPALLGVLVALIGFILTGGGAYLAALGEAGITFWSARCFSPQAIS